MPDESPFITHRVDPEPPAHKRAKGDKAVPQNDADRDQKQAPRQEARHADKSAKSPEFSASSSSSSSVASSSAAKQRDATKPPKPAARASGNAVKLAGIRQKGLARPAPIDPYAAGSGRFNHAGVEQYTGAAARSSSMALIAYALFLPVFASITTVCAMMFYTGRMTTQDHYGMAVLIGAASILVLVFVRTVMIYRERAVERHLLKELFDGSRSARLVTDINNATLYTNGRFQALCSMDGGGNGLDGLTALFSYHEVVAARFQVLVENAQRGAFETAQLPALIDGDERWLSISAQPVAGRAGCVQWLVEDVTDSHNSDSLIREEREKLLDFTDNAPVGFFSVNEDGRFLFVNATLARWLGTDIDELLSAGRLHSYIDDAPAKARPFDLFEGAGAKQVCELRMKGPGGRVFLASVSQSVVHEAEDRVRTRAVVHDLTAEREMRQALKDSEDRFQRFFEEAPLGIVLVNTHGVISDCNAAFARMLQMKVESLEGRDFETLIKLEVRSTVMRTITSIEEGKHLDAPIELMLHTPEKDVYVQMHARKFRGRNIVLHFIDLTEQKTLEAQFVQSQKMQAIGQLAGGVAHDFNNLLTAMIGFCDLLLLRHKAGDPSFNDIMQIKQNANRAANLVRQLLAFSRQQTLQPRVLDITDTLTELSHLLRRLLGVGIEFEVVHDPDIGLIKADEGQLEQVLINLAVNARDAMDGNGGLTIRTYNYRNTNPIKRGSDTMPAGEWVAIEAADTGCGIPDEILERIFEPFFTTKEIGSGTGLGLATVYGIMRQTGGYVHVDSTVGKGTSFILYLPVHVPDEKDAVLPKKIEHIEDKDLTGTATILLVEDEDAVRGFGARALRNKGYEVLEAASAEDALELIAQDSPSLDLMVTDVIMPEMDGPTLARHVLEKMPNLPIIFVSGYTEDRFKDEFKGFNVSFLPKPFTLQQLASKVKDVLTS